MRVYYTCGSVVAGWRRKKGGQTKAKADGVVCCVSSRFVLTSIADVKGAQAKQAADADKEMEGLNKKLQYLETTNKNANEHLERILGGGGGS